MVNDMLDNSKIDAVGTMQQQNIVGLRNCMEEVLDMFAAKASENNCDLLYDIAADVPMQVTGDNKRLQQVLINLVENVMGTRKEQQVFIGVHLIQTDATNAPQLGFEVGNMRIGNATELVYQLGAGNELKDYSPENEKHDKSLGLALSKKLVEEMNGHIRTTVGIETGINFIFSIPFTAAEPAESPAFLTMKGFEGRKVLVVHHNVIAADIISKQLEQWKLLPVVSFTGIHALEILSHDTFSMIITNLQLHDMDGIF